MPALTLKEHIRKVQKPTHNGVLHTQNKFSVKPGKPFFKKIPSLNTPQFQVPLQLYLLSPCLSVTRP